MDHEVEDDVDIEAAGAEDAEAVDFEKQGLAGDFFERDDSGVEALEVADLEDAGVGIGGVDEAVGGGEVGGDGLFDKDVDTGFEERAGYVGVGGGGDGDDGGVDFSGELAGIGEGEAGVGGGDFSGAGGIGVDDGDELGAGGLADNAHVVAAEFTDADYGYADF
ncbi:MAG TPA: hypothetical protein VKP66_04955 [Steroidobacteraceae bacterium]|nr:hypothetical protein [Steroidobacteraceae bacterium]